MRFIQEHTTKRYFGNKNCDFEEFLPDMEDSYQYGCEFEFYIDKDKHAYFDETLQKDIDECKSG